MRTHVQRTVSRYFEVLRQLRHIHHSIPASTFQTLVVALIHSRLDYGNSVLVGLPAYLVRRLQSVFNAAVVIKWVQLLEGAPPTEFGRAKNVQNLARFLTTFEFDSAYLRNGST